MIILRDVYRARRLIDSQPPGTPLIYSQLPREPGLVVAVMIGGNIDPELLKKIIEGY
ncbi:MAG: hypothetical protein L7G96_04455 [Vulcanisaeta sp.]|jgi:hypothetical protein|nr:hypothetical protein [Vulcanisaeta sp.]